MSLADVSGSADHWRSSSSDRQIKQRSRRPHLPPSILTLRTEVLNPRRQRFSPHLSHFSPLAVSIWEPLHQKASVEGGPLSPPLTQQTLNGCQAEHACPICFLRQQRLRLKRPPRLKVAPDWNKWRKRVKSTERTRK